MINDCGFKDEGHPICNDLKNENLHLGWDVGDTQVADVHICIECESALLWGRHVKGEENTRKNDVSCCPDLLYDLEHLSPDHCDCCLKHWYKV
jgi:hypothetical protein